MLSLSRLSLGLNDILLIRLIEPINLEKAVDLYQKAAGVFEVRSSLQQYHLMLFCFVNTSIT